MTDNASTSNVSATSTRSGKSSETSNVPTALQSADSLIAHDLEMEKTLVRRSKGRENVRDKSKRLLVSGRLRVVKVDGNLIVGECRGDSGEVYSLGHEPGSPKPWRCTCAALGPCSHLMALWAVCAVRDGRSG